MLCDGQPDLLTDGQHRLSLVPGGRYLALLLIIAGHSIYCNIDYLATTRAVLTVTFSGTASFTNNLPLINSPPPYGITSYIINSCEKAAPE